MRRSLAVLFGCSAIALSPQLATAQSAGPELTIGWAEPIDTLNPATTGARNVGPILSNIFDTLVWLTPEFKVEPLLATDWTVSEDGLTYTFNLRDDVTFHDGTPFNADAVVKNFDYIKDDTTQSKIGLGLLGSCKNAEATAEFTVVVTCEAPYAPLLAQMGEPYLGMQSPAAIEKYGKDLGQHPIGTGPFKFISWAPNQSVVLERFDDYDWMAASLEHEGPADIGKITFSIVPNPQARVNQFQSGQSQVMQQVPGVYWKSLGASGRYQSMQVPISGMGIFLPINASKWPTDDVAVRKAILYAVDVKGVVQLAENGVFPVSRFPLTEGMLGYDASTPDPYPYDPAKATELLEGAGWTKTDGKWMKDGKPLGIIVSAISTKAHYMAIGQAIQGYLNDFGMSAELQGLAVPAWLAANINGEATMAPGQYIGVDPDALHFWFLPDQYFNWSHWSDPELTKLITTGQSLQDDDKRREIYGEVQKIIMDNAVMMPIRQNIDLTMMAPDVKGMTYSGGGFQYFGAASLGE